MWQPATAKSDQQIQNQSFFERISMNFFHQKLMETETVLSGRFQFTPQQP